MGCRYPLPKYGYISLMKTFPLQELKIFHKNSLVIKGQIQYDLRCFCYVHENTYFSISPIIFFKRIYCGPEIIRLYENRYSFVALYLKETVQKKCLTRLLWSIKHHPTVCNSLISNSLIL